MKDAILSAALALARTHGLRRFTRQDVAARAETATGTVSYHFGSMAGLRDAVVTLAVDNEVLDVIAQALAEKHPAAAKASEALQRRAARDLVALTRI